MINFPQWEKTREDKFAKYLEPIWKNAPKKIEFEGKLKQFLHQDRLELLKYIKESLPKGSIDEDIKCDGECTPACGWDECLHEVESLLDDMLNQCSKK